MSFEQDISRWHRGMERLEQLKGLAIYPSPPDNRDYRVELISAPLLPDKVELPDSPIILNQGQTPFCGGASGAGIANAYYNNLGVMPKNGFSMTFIYWLAKQYDGIPNLEGTYLRTVLKVMSKYGCAPEDNQPFSTEKFPDIKQEALRKAAEFKVKSYYRVSTPYELKVALSKGYYILLATFITRDNWRSGNGGWISGPSGDFAGGHATRSNGYNDNLRSNVHSHIGYFFGGNSWGIRWGDQGKFYLPYDYWNFKVIELQKSKFIEAWAVEFEPFSKQDSNDNNDEDLTIIPKFKRPTNWRFLFAAKKKRGKH